MSRLSRCLHRLRRHRKDRTCRFALCAWLAAHTDINDVSLNGEELRFSHTGDRDSEVVLLKEMVLADFRVAEFASHSQSLEDVFMAVTKGVVQ